MDKLLVELFVQAHESPRADRSERGCDRRSAARRSGGAFVPRLLPALLLPLYIFCGELLLCARLRRADQDGAAGTVDELQRIIRRIRRTWPAVRLIVRGDSGFCREDLMAWCEAQGVDYVLGLAKNSRLKVAIAAEMAEARTQHERTGQAARVFRDFRYCTRTSWSCERRMIGKAEHLSKGENPRFVVTSLSTNTLDALALSEDLYCARDEMENRIKEQQMALFADRTSTHEMRSNQLRLYFYLIRLCADANAATSGAERYVTKLSS